MNLKEPVKAVSEATEVTYDDQVKVNPIYAFVKRGFDIVVSFVALTLLLIPLIILGIVVWCSSKGPALFRQERIGRNSKPFVIYKFRTMSAETPKNVATADLKNPYAYITKVGAFMRKTSLDELPQLWNILKGDMSLIGPRPVIPQETKLLDLRRKYGADKVRPGMTGLAQIRGRDNISIKNKAKYDAEYAHNCTLKMDCGILFHSVGYVLKSEGVREGSW
jgi:O-antigen biosynthesis protein WbqP